MRRYTSYTITRYTKWVQVGADYYYFAPTYHQLLRIHFSAFTARRSFSRFLKNTIMIFGAEGFTFFKFDGELKHAEEF